MSSAGDARMEPNTVADTDDGHCLHSIAISLKRIADTLSGEGPSIMTMPLNQYGEGIGECIQGQFERGQR